MPDVGDRIAVTSKGKPRSGVVTAASGAMITVRWDTGGETSLVPGPGVLSVVTGRRSTQSKRAAGKKTARTKPVAGKAARGKKVVAGKKTARTKPVARKAARGKKVVAGKKTARTKPVARKAAPGKKRAAKGTSSRRRTGKKTR